MLLFILQFVTFLTVSLSAGWWSSPARFSSACGSTRSWGRCTGSQVGSHTRYPAIFSRVASRVEGGGLCYEDSGGQKCSTKLSNSSQFDSQQAYGQPGRHKVKYKKISKQTNSKNTAKLYVDALVWTTGLIDWLDWVEWIDLGFIWFQSNEPRLTEWIKLMITLDVYTKLYKHPKNWKSNLFVKYLE